MAIVSSEAIQAELDATEKNIQIVRSNSIDASHDEHYCIGVTAPYAGKARWIGTTPTDSAAVQAAALLAGMA
jgi:hypothetical protein